MATHHLLSARQFDRLSLDIIFEATCEMKYRYEQEENDPYSSLLVRPNGTPLRFRLLFRGDSTRTEASFEDTIESLGGRFITKRLEFSGAAKGETHWSIARILGPRCDGFIVRDDSPEGKTGIHRMAEAIDTYHLKCPVINAGNGLLEHPTQTLLDIHTIREYKQYEFENGKLTFGLIGDLAGSRTIHSLLLGLNHFGGHVILIGPAGWDIPPEFYKILSERPNLTIERTTDLLSVAHRLDIAYFTRLQKNLRGEKISPEEEQAYAANYGATKDVRYRMKKDAIGMHPLPHGPEFPDESTDTSIDLVDERFVHFKQADNGFHVRRAILAEMYVQNWYEVLAGQNGQNHCKPILVDV